MTTNWDSDVLEDDKGYYWIITYDIKDRSCGTWVGQEIISEKHFETEDEANEDLQHYRWSKDLDW
jgi:hypothetical protein